jgi:hypothetical protein
MRPSPTCISYLIDDNLTTRRLSRYIGKNPRRKDNPANKILEEITMKKIIAITLVMVLALSLLTACGGNDNSNNGTDGNSKPTSNNGGNNTGDNNDNKKLAMSVTKPGGWDERTRGDGTIIYEPKDVGTYPNTLVMLSIENNRDKLGGRAYVEKKIENEKPYYKQNEYSSVGDVTAAGQDAFSYNVVDTQTETVSRYTFIFKGDNVYIYQDTIMTEHMNDLLGDLDAMYESYTLK